MLTLLIAKFATFTGNSKWRYVCSHCTAVQCVCQCLECWSYCWTV